MGVQGPIGGDQQMFGAAGFLNLSQSRERPEV
jgi:hypothetical protein